MFSKQYLNLLCLFDILQGNWNYFAAIRNEKRNPKLEATHLEKAKELYTRVRVFYHLFFVSCCFDVLSFNIWFY